MLDSETCGAETGGGFSIGDGGVVAESGCVTWFVMTVGGVGAAADVMGGVGLVSSLV